MLWQKVILPAGHAKRGGLPPRLNQQWFEKTFCGGTDLEHVAEQGEEGKVCSHVSGLTHISPYLPHISPGLVARLGPHHVRPAHAVGGAPHDARALLRGGAQDLSPTLSLTP